MRATSGPSVLDLLRTRGDQVALLIADQRMPGMPGTDYLVQARTIVPTPSACCSPPTPTPRRPALGAVIAARFSGGVRERIDVASFSPTGQAAVRGPEERVLARADVSGLPAAEATSVARATEAASVQAFHTGMGISAVLVACGGILGLAFVRNPRREVACAGCAGGQLVGAPTDAARDREPSAVPA